MISARTTGDGTKHQDDQAGAGSAPSQDGDVDKKLSGLPLVLAWLSAIALSWGIVGIVGFALYKGVAALFS